MKRTKVSFDTVPATPAGTSVKLTETGSGFVLAIPAAPFHQLYLIPAVIGCLFALFFGASVLPRLFTLTGPPAVRYGIMAAAILLFIFVPILSAVSFYRRKSRECVLVNYPAPFCASRRRRAEK